MSTATFSAATAFALALTLLPCATVRAEQSAADGDWKKVQDSMSAVEHPAKRPQSKAEAITIYKELVQNFDTASKSFADAQPKDPRRWTAQVFAGKTFMLRKQLSLPGGIKDISTAMEEVIQAPDATAKDKGEASGIRLIFTAGDVDSGKMSAEAWQKLAETHLKDYPDFEGNSEIKSQVATMKTNAELKSKPLDLKFQSVDGHEVDLASLRGKVVLVDFWATWCGPCVGEVPHVVETYEKLHAKGFEIIGISLDQDKEKLLSFTKDKKMTWEQYFDGKGWENQIAGKFGIHSIPAMWLVNKKGMVVSTNARGQLEEEVTKLLAE